MAESTRRTAHPRRLRAAEGLVVGVLAFVAGALAMQMFLAPAPAEGQTGTGASAALNTGPGNVFAIAGQLSRETYGLYLVDYQNSTMCVYEYLPGDRRLRLMAARTFLYDRQLDSYNTEPTPAEVRKWVAGASRLKDVKEPTTQP